MPPYSRSADQIVTFSASAIYCGVEAHLPFATLFSPPPFKRPRQLLTMKLLNFLLTFAQIVALAASMSTHEKRWIVYLTGYGS